MAVTLKDIAIKAGIDVGSVSRVLNDHPKAMELKESTRENIRSIARAMGYSRNAMARAVVTGRSRVIAFIAGDMGMDFYTGKIQEGVFEGAGARGYAVSFYHLKPNNQSEIVGKLKEWRVAGAVFHAPDIDSVADIVQALKGLDVPFGFANLCDTVDAGVVVTTDDFQGSIEAVKHLAGLGHRRIAHATTCRDKVKFAVLRRDGYLEGMRRFVPDEAPRIVTGSNCPDAEFERLLSEPEDQRPTAAFCFMDNWAMTLTRAAGRLGIKVPEELSIVGFGDLDMAAYAVAPLTTVSQPFREMGRLTAEKVIATIENPTSPRTAIHIKLQAQLRVRASTAAPPRATWARLIVNEKKGTEYASRLP